MLASDTKEPTPTLPARAERLDYLDSARGIAALMVLFGHFISYGREDLLEGKIATMVFNGADAVSFFFLC